MRCDRCGYEVGDGARFCRVCGNEIKRPRKEKKRGFLVLKIFLVLIVAVLIVVGLLFWKKISSDPNEFILAGKWYEYGWQDVFVDEWTFYDDGTCTSEMRCLPGDETKFEKEYALYTVSGNTVTIYRDGRETTWEYDAEEDCFWFYSSYSSPDGEDLRYFKLKIVHYDRDGQKAFKEELYVPYDRDDWPKGYLIKVDEEVYRSHYDSYKEA